MKKIEIQGEIAVNRERIPSPSFMSLLSGYVQQDDAIVETMKVEEAVNMSTQLRMPHISEGERQQRLNRVLHLLQIEKCRKTLVGSSTRKGISGGERKRTNIAMELVTTPPILFLVCFISD